MRLKLFAVSLACLWASSLWAQDITKDTIRLEEVVVTSQWVRPTEVGKLPVPLSQAPLSVASMGKETIKDLQLNSMIEVTRNLTGIRPNNTYGGFQTFNIRGFNVFVVVTDGVRDERHNLYQSAPNTSLAAIESIEVLKGASSVMYGHSALGGVISIVHKQPTAANHVNAQMSIGSWGRYGIQGGGSGSINSKLTFRTDFSMSGGEGWRHTNDKAYNAYIALKYAANDRNQFNFSVSAKDDFYGTDTGQPHINQDVYDSTGKLVYTYGDLPEGYNRRQRYNDPKDHLTDKDLTITAKWTHQLNNPRWSVSDYLSYYYDDLDYYASEKLTYLTSSDAIYDHYYMSSGSKTYICLDTLQRVGYQFAYLTSLVQNQLEVKGEFKTGEVKHNLLGGYSLSYLYTPRYTANYSSDASGAGAYAHVAVVNPVLNQGNVDLPFQKRNIIWENMHGIYVQDYLNITDKLSGLVSLRYDRFNRTYQQGYTSNKTITSKDAKAHIHDNALTYRLSLLYQFNELINVYASTSNYFKPTRTVASSSYMYVGSDGKLIEPSGSNVFDPESGYQYEAGTHIAMSEKLSANVAGFYILRENVVESLGSYNGYTVSGQVGRTQSKGFEVDVNYTPCRGFNLNAGYTFTECKIISYAENEYAANTNAGNLMNHAPKHLAYGWAFYNFNRTLSGLKVGAGFNASSRTFANTANTLAFGGYGLANAMVAYNYKNWRMQLNVNNIFDKNYYMTSVNTIGFIPEEGRNVRFTLAFEL